VSQEWGKKRTPNVKLGLRKTVAKKVVQKGKKRKIPKKRMGHPDTLEKNKKGGVKGVPRKKY